MKSNGKKKRKNAKTAIVTTKRSFLLGFGLDNKDGHVRVTSGPNFRLLGGSEETHESLQETAIKMNEELARRGKALEQVSRDELQDIIHRVIRRAH